MTPEVIAVLKRCDIAGDTVVLPVGEMLPRPLYEAVTKELQGRGGVWRGGKVKFLKLPPNAGDTLRADLAKL